jgi:hypothetical protein
MFDPGFRHCFQQDCYALRDVTSWLAEHLGVSVECLLVRFAVSVDMPETLRSMGCVL